MAGTIHVGCSGWAYPAWRDVLYPTGLAQRRWLERDAEVFETVEVNSTFYRLASPPAVECWVQATPPGFRFTVKASRYLTHITHLQYSSAACSASTRASSRWSRAASSRPCSGSCRRPRSATTSCSAHTTSRS